MTLDLGGLPPRLFSCTPTRLASWLDCPRRYHFTYVQRPVAPKGAWAHLSLGTSVHLALKDWWSLPISRRTPEAVVTALHRQWQAAGFLDDEQQAHWQAVAAGWLTRYVESAEHRDEPAGLERTVAARTARLAFSGRVDRIDVRNGRAVVVDYKTGRSRPDDLDARGSLALAMYAVATAATLRVPCTTVELHHLPTGSVASWDHDEKSLSRHASRADSIGSEAQQAEARAAAGEPLDDVFPPNPGSRCGWCDFRDRCEEGRAVAAPQPSWAGLGPDPSDGGDGSGFTVGVGPDTPDTG